ncbi:MAG TPA: cellulose synthase complex periplasmic endoglucanase BcsZ [Terracidiphilus sp.]|nr:cellulose synthase complex periplasmic endoglucanase BcsZ [Terracidiphilus sp.]
MGLRMFLPGKRWLPILLLSMLFTTGGCRKSSWSLWESYSARFIDAQGRVFDHKSDQHTTSEGQAYSLFFALAGKDLAHFDQVLTWTKVNLANGDLQTHLPAWLWGKDKDGTWKALDPNSASDADVRMAYTLVEAGHLWQIPLYSNLGRKMMTQIAASEAADLPGFGLIMLPGHAGFQHDKTWTLNPSYLPVFLFERLAVVDAAGPWRQIARNIPRLLEQSARHGFAMDWVEYFPGDGFYPAAEQKAGSRITDGPGGSYDAIRVYLWAGMLDGRGKMRTEIVNDLPTMGAYLGNHAAPPEKVSDQSVTFAQEGPVGFSVSLLTYLNAFPDRSRISAQQMIRMSLMRDQSTGLYGKELTYYDQNLALFATGFLNG